ncbi:MAG: conjugal transfer protein TraD, partial [Novosphingobium sp.]|nr:conjugal transfer protein TraD [Novosphingobium sp.]
HHLMHADLSAVHKMLENTIADPLTATQAARMAESIRAVFNTNAQVIRFLPDPVEGGLPPFSINAWMREEERDGGILFITSTHTDLTLNRALLTLWMDMAVNALMRLERTRDLRTWFLFDEVHALHRLPAIEHGLQTARAFGGAFVLGMHSFDKLAETYGEQGAVNLASLARTKLILSTADMETARVCTEFIGNREVREMDEAYSYGYNNTRDASTLTPRTEVKPLVIPDDIMNLPSLYGFLKFPDGFPATRIRLAWRDYPVVAAPWRRRATLTAAPFVPPGATKPAEEGEGGVEPVPARAATMVHGLQAPSAPEDRTRVSDDLFTAADRREVTAGEREADTRAAGEPAAMNQPEAGLAGIIGNMRSQGAGEPRAAESARDAAIGRRAGIAVPRKTPEQLAAREEPLGFDNSDRHARRGHEGGEPGLDHDDGPALGD